jgi:hypothetical protein
LRHSFGAGFGDGRTAVPVICVAMTVAFEITFFLPEWPIIEVHILPFQGLASIGEKV